MNIEQFLNQEIDNIEINMSEKIKLNWNIPSLKEYKQCFWSYNETSLFYINKYYILNLKIFNLVNECKTASHHTGETRAVAWKKKKSNSVELKRSSAVAVARHNLSIFLTPWFPKPQVTWVAYVTKCPHFLGTLKKKKNSFVPKK